MVVSSPPLLHPYSSLPVTGTSHILYLLLRNSLPSSQGCRYFLTQHSLLQFLLGLAKTLGGCGSRGTLGEWENTNRLHVFGFCLALRTMRAVEAPALLCSVFVLRSMPWVLCSTVFSADPSGRNACHQRNMLQSFHFFSFLGLECASGYVPWPSSHSFSLGL